MTNDIVNALPVEIMIPTMEHETLLSFEGPSAYSNDIQAPCVVEDGMRL